MTRPFSRLLLAALFALFCIPLASSDSLAEKAKPWIHEIRFGVLDHDTDNLWSGFSEESGIDLNAELIFSPSYQIWHGRIRPNLGLSVNTEGNTSKVYAGGVWQYLFKKGFFFDLGAGLAIHDGETDNPQAIDSKELGSRVLLHFSFELGYTVSAHSRISLMFDHVSNGYTNDPNEGLDTVGIRYGYLL